MKKLFTVGLVVTGASLMTLFPEFAVAEVELPSWAGTGNLDQELNNKGKAVADIAATIVGALAIIGMLVGAALFPLNKPDEGKKWVMGGGIGLIIAGSVAGIAQLFLTK